MSSVTQNHSMALISDNFMGEGLQPRRGDRPLNISSSINVSTIDGDIQNASTTHQRNMTTIASLAIHKPQLGNFTTVQYGGNSSGQYRNSTGGLYHASLSPAGRNFQKGHKPTSFGGPMCSTSLLNSSSLIHYGQYENTEATSGYRNTSSNIFP